MKTSHGKLAILGFALLLAALLLGPMRAGQEDELIFRPGALKLSAGGSYKVSCALRSDEAGQTLRFSTADAGVATIASDGTVTAHAPGETTISARASGGATAQLRVLVDGTPLTELKLNTDALYMEKGQFSGLSVSYNADASDARLQWISEDECVARVDSAGRIEAVGGGETIVSVVATNGMRASARVHVDVDAVAAHISPNALTLGVGAKVPLKLSFLPEDATDRALGWYSSDERVLTMDENGLLSAVGEGRAYVSVRTEDGLTSGMEVAVEAAPEDIRLDPSKATLERGDTLDMQLIFLEKDGSEQKTNHLVVWQSSDESIASVDANGRVTALRSGSCEITASADGKRAKCRLEVQVTVHEIQLEQTQMDLLREDTDRPIQLKWTISPADADNPALQFASNNEQVATVNRQGLVQLSGGYGTAIITASSESGASACFTVNVVTELPSAAQATEIPQATQLPQATAIPQTTAIPQASAAPAEQKSAAVG